MLQFPAQLLPVAGPRKDIVFSNDHPSHAHKHGLRSAAPRHSTPLSVNTNFSPSPSPSSSSPPATAVKPRSPYISSRKLLTPVSSSSPKPWQFSPPSASRPSSIASSTLEDVFSPGDIVGEGCTLQGDTIRLVSTAADEEPANEFEVVKQLGKGSYAVVYQVREVLSRPPPSEDGHMSLMGSMELNGELSRSASVHYGREYAMKCLSKANLDDGDLAAQMSEVTIHQSLRSHPNIVTLHRTFETSSFLLLLLEFVPGEDLFYFLEQARDHHHHESESPSSDSSQSSSYTPPTPSLLSRLHPSQLLSRTRLRLISSMFSQMCDAVAACHDQQVFHRDIKPENFIVTDGWTIMPDGRRERRVVVKLTDFGLSTKDIESSDMDCGSAPYMSYECRNNISPTYRPRGADVWSLGIVLINMLYHNNPWTDTRKGACASFDIFLQQPVNFFMHRFPGMTRPVAEFFANNVFCILDGPEDDSTRIDVADLGAWAKDLPTLLGNQRSGHQRVVSSTSIQGHPIASTPISHRPSSRPPSACGTPALRTPAMQVKPLSSLPSLGPAYEIEASELSTVIDQEVEEQDEAELKEDRDINDGDTDGMGSRSQSHNKRRKRGARSTKRKETSVPRPKLQDELPPPPVMIPSIATQSLVQSYAREVSKTSRTTGRVSGKDRRNIFDPVYPMQMSPTIPNPRLNPSKPGSSAPKLSPVPPSPVPPGPTIARKPSKWKLPFGRNTSVPSVVDDSSPTLSSNFSSTSPESDNAIKASNVSNLIKSLSPPQAQRRPDADDPWSRGRQFGRNPVYQNSNGSGNWGAPGQVPSAGIERWVAGNNDISSASARTGRPLASSASSTYSSNWRSSMSTTSSATTSTSAFTKYSNGSARSVSTAATSVSSSSWRTPGKPSPGSSDAPPPNMPKNIKFMTGVPYELDELPRQLGSDLTGDNLGKPSTRNKQRTRKPKDGKLDTINERPGLSPGAQDASTSTTDLGEVGGEGDGPKKVQKGQINALAKMLSALRR